MKRGEERKMKKKDKKQEETKGSGWALGDSGVWMGGHWGQLTASGRDRTLAILRT